MKKAVIFDLDGTLLDTLEDLKDAVNAALIRYCQEPRTLEQVRSYVGNGVQRLMELSVPDGLANPRFSEIFTYFKAYYKEHSNEKTKPYPGVMELLGQLRAGGVTCAIVSNKLDGAVKELNRLYFTDYIEVAIGEMEGVARKPAADTVMKALQELGITKEEAIYVGDSEVDVLTGKNADMEVVCVDWGFRSREELREAGAGRIVSDPCELMRVLSEEF